MRPADAKALAIRIVAGGVRVMILSGPFAGLSDEESDQVRAALVEIVLELNQRRGVRSCSRCGCTEDDPCEDGCAWVLGAEPDLCTACYAEADSVNRILVVSR